MGELGLVGLGLKKRERERERERESCLKESMICVADRYAIYEGVGLLDGYKRKRLPEMQTSDHKALVSPNP